MPTGAALVEPVEATVGGLQADASEDQGDAATGDTGDEAPEQDAPDDDGDHQISWIESRLWLTMSAGGLQEKNPMSPKHGGTK